AVASCDAVIRDDLRRRRRRRYSIKVFQTPQTFFTPMAPALSSNWAKLQKKTKTKSSKVTKTSTTQPKEKKEVSNLIKTKRLAKEIATAKLNRENSEIKAKTLEVSKAKDSTAYTASQKSPGRYLAIDCEFVGIGIEGTEDALARVSIVNFHGYCVYDKFVKPQEKVVDWRTWVSGVRPSDMADAISFKQAQIEVDELLKGKVLVGHAVQHDLDALFLSHPKSMIRDTSKHANYRKISKGKTPGLKKLVAHFLKKEIQSGEHSSVEDARATMELYKLEKKEFEKLASRFNNHSKKETATASEE
ncbi:hypothetical protein WICPIJ_005466, partial [Wickerhamomyces pijperi]